MGNLAYYKIGDQYIIVLLDFDLATTTDSAENTSQRRTGTAPFMSRDVLSAIGPEGKYIHHVRHDLESVFCIIIWYGLGYNARGPRDGKPDLLELWRVGDYIKIYEAKVDFISQDSPSLLNYIESTLLHGVCYLLHGVYHERARNIQRKQKQLNREQDMEVEKAARKAKADALQQGHTEEEAEDIYTMALGTLLRSQNRKKTIIPSTISFKQWMNAVGRNVSEKHSDCSCCNEDLFL